jgi:ribosome-associated translation inhibitor RaiA
MITFRHFEARPSLKRRIEAENDHLARLFRRIVSIEWDVKRAGAGYVASCRVHSRSGYYRARSDAGDVAACVDAILERLMSQRRRRKRKALSGRHALAAR